MQHYLIITSEDNITERENIITKYLSCGIAGFVEQWIRKDIISLEDAMQYLYMCMRNNLKNMRDLLPD